MPGFDAPIPVGGHVIGDGHPAFFIIEEGQANQGSLETAVGMIHLAARAHAPAIEFQFSIADDFYVRSHPGHALYRKREFSKDELTIISRTAANAGIVLSATPLADKLVETLADIGYGLFNVNSSDLVNPRMLDAVAMIGLPFMLSTAMATVEEIDWAVERVLRRGATDFILLHGQHVMANGRRLSEKEVSLSTIGWLRDRYKVPVGFIDHTASVLIPALAAAHGAAVVTKHLAPREGWRGPDWQVCLTPEEMSVCIRLVRLANAAAGSAEKSFAAGEEADRSFMRRSIVAAADLPSGHVLRAGDLLLKRPGTGIEARQLESLIGRVLTRAVGEDELITPAHIE